MMISHLRRYRWPGALALTIVASTAGAAGVIDAIELDLNAARIQAGLRIARGPEAGRAAFHLPYQIATNDPAVGRLEIITEYRRLVLMGEERIASGDRGFEQGGRVVENALGPYRRRVSVVARVRFHPQNAYVTAPPVDIALTGASGDVPRLDLRSNTQYAMASGAANQQLPLTGVDGEAVFDATAIGQTLRTAIVRLNGKELTRVTIDFSRLD